MDGLSIQFRVAYDNFKTDYDHFLGANDPDYEIIDDFVDTRLYIDYMF